MHPLLYVEEELRNVERALDESLRYDYGPGQTVDYYDECRFRLKGIKAELERLKIGNGVSTSDVVSQLWDLANRLTLIERSHLGEFSWPFADAIRQIASKLLSEDEGLRDRIEPIIHMIAEGTSYQILSEKILNTTKKRRMFTVAFPRQLKHHVLMHALFGHELGHATFYSNRTAEDGAKDDKSSSDHIIDVLRSEGPLRDCAATMQWLSSPEAPAPVRERTARAKGSITEANLEHWHVELVCDLFGLVIFGPAFSAAHRAYLEPSCKSKFEVEIEKTSHPAFVLRRTLLSQALRVMGWDEPVAPETKRRRGGIAALSKAVGWDKSAKLTEAEQLRKAEEAFIEYITGDHYGSWAQVFSDAQVKEAIRQIRERFLTTGAVVARRPDLDTYRALVTRIARHLPPIREEMDEDGVSRTFEVRIEEQLYAGWTYWLGQEHIGDPDPLSFFQLNQLCDLALLQQQAIDIVAKRRFV